MIQPRFLGAQETNSLSITDTIEYFHYKLVIKRPSQFLMKKSKMTHGGNAITFSSNPPLSFIAVIEAANTEINLGDDCNETIEYELNDRFVAKGFCPFKGYYRVDRFKNSRIKICYQVVPTCELEAFEEFLDSAVLIFK
jgi:hypothetical protein